VESLRATGQLEQTLIVLSSDNGPHMETWPDSAYTPFRCAKGSTWEGGVRVPALFVWPGMIEADRVSDGLMNFSDLLPTAVMLAGAPERVPTDRYIDGIDQTSFLLAPDGTSRRKYHYYWLVDTFSGLRAGEYKWMLSSTSDDDADVHGTGGFTGVTQRYTYPRLYNLYLDPKERHSYVTRKLAYLEVLREGMRAHLATFQAYPPKRVTGLRASGRPQPG
jgi:arylsulfatase